MKFINHNFVLNLVGFFLIFLVLFKVTYNIYFYNYYSIIFWFCNFSALILGVGIIFRLKSLIGSVFLTSIPAQFLWIIDFILLFFLDIGFGRTSDLLLASRLEFYLSIILHVILIPISVYAVYILGLSRNSYKYAIILFIFTLLPLTFFLTDPIDNINCVFYQCDLSYDELIETNQSLLYEKNILTLFYSMGFWLIIAIFAYLVYILGLKKKIKFSN